MNTSNLSRRNFLRNSGLSGAGLLLGLYLPNKANAEFFKGEDELVSKDIEMCAWIIISTAGKVTIIDHRAEMGQGSYQSVPQIVAEELEVDLKDVQVQFAQGNKKYGNQITGGSSTIRGGYKKLLKLSATAREMLIAAAAAKWGTTAADCYAKSGYVFHKLTGKKLNYGDLAEDASKLETPKEVLLKKRSEYKLIGKPLLRKDTPLKITGQAVFGLDKRVPGMLFASIERSPRMRGKVKSFDDSAALKVPGVQKVFTIKAAVFNTTREGVAVVANSTWAAQQGKKALKIEWDDSGFEHLDTPAIFKQQEDLLQKEEGLSFKKQGDPTAFISQAAQKLDVVYQTPYQSHSAMEPLNCIAHYQEDKVEIWGPVQAPDWVQDNISKELKISRDKVIVNMTFLGGGFGRKALTDYPHEAVMASKEMGAPVQVVWSREDDTMLGPFRPGISYRCEGVVEGGAISALKFRLAGQNISQWMTGKMGEPNDSTSEGFLKPYFQSIKNVSFADVPFQTPIPVSFWRSVYASTNGFAYESFIDELAHAANQDPLYFRRQHLKDDRSQRLIDKMEAVSGWKNRKPNEGFGTAITECFDSTVGQVVKLSRRPDGKIKIDKVWAVMDCGWYVNPDIVKAQVEGSIVMALGAATLHEITFKDGKPEQHNFYDYKMPRITDIPPIEVFIMENDADAGGVGEPGLPAFAPALTAAIFDLTGTRIRKLPFDMNTI